jgi:NodT family efflux transporter outer membrane factor (OMF) lipoprotein
MRDEERAMRQTPRGRRAGSLFFLFTATGCLVGPDYVEPDAAVSPTWMPSEDPRVKSDPLTEIEWWKTFDDPLLNALVEEAFAQNLSLRQAAVRVMQAVASRGIAVGELFPQTQELGGASDRTKFSENPDTPQRYRSTYDVGFDAAWELDVWGRLRRNVESADAILDASLASYDNVMVSLVAEVAASYLDLRTTEVLIAIAKENVKLQEESLRLAESRFTHGQTSELDTTDATALLEQTRAEIPGLRVQLQQAMFQLDFLLGMPPSDLMDRLGDPGKIPSAPAEIAIGISADLLRRRPDIRLAERQAAAQSAQIGLAEADLYPSFVLSGNLGYQSDTTGSLFESKSWTGSLSPGFRWPIFNYGRIENNVRVQDAAFQAAILDYQIAVLAAAQEVENGLASFLGAQEQIGHYEASVKASERSLELSEIQYKEGSSTFTRVVDAQVQLRSAQQSLAATQGQVAQSLIATYKALGGGWEVRRGMNILPEETRAEMEQRTDWGGMLDPDYVEGRDLGIRRHDPTGQAAGSVDEGED